MKVRNLTPAFPVGTKVTSRRPPQREITVIVRGLFTLVPGQPVEPVTGVAPPMAQEFLRAESFADGDDDRMGAPTYPGDFADHKLGADVLLLGVCHPKGGNAVTECPVRFSVGKWSKVVRVVGRRVAAEDRIGVAMSEPIPFTSMPLGFEQSFGGAGFADNPVGRGFKTKEMPNIEPVEGPLQDKDGAARANGFGPVSSHWASRKKKLGRDYGDDYQKTRAPFYSSDFDWSHFHAAPAEQQLGTYLRGDEELRFQNLHPEVSEWSAKLPGLRVRAFVMDDHEVFREVRMNLDTLLADTDNGRLMLTWRGLDAVREDDLLDVRTLLVASEPLAEAPLPASVYREKLVAFERDPMGLEDLPPEAREAYAEMEKMQQAPPPAADAPQNLASVLKSLERAPPDARAKLEGAVAQMVAAAKANNVDLDAEITKATAPLPKRKPHEPSLARRGMDELDKPVGKARDAAKEAGQDASALDAFDRAKSHPTVAKLVAMDPPPGPGADLSGRDFIDTDLSGLDLRGANLSGAILTGALLVGTNLSGANLSKIVGGDLELAGADLTGADLTEALLAGAKAAGTIFDRAVLVRTVLVGADLTKASLREAKVTYSILQGAKMAGAVATAARFDNVLFDSADLTSADFSRAELASCLLTNVTANGATFRGAMLGKSTFQKGQLQDAIFVDARGPHVSFRGATLDRADFRFAVLPGCHFGQSAATAATFLGADLRSGDFYRCVHEHCDYSWANLFAAKLSKAALSHTKFTNASLFEASVLQSSGKNADFSGANLKRLRSDAR